MYKKNKAKRNKFGEINIKRTINSPHDYFEDLKETQRFLNGVLYHFIDEYEPKDYHYLKSVGIELAKLSNRLIDYMDPVDELLMQEEHQKLIRLSRSGRLVEMLKVKTKKKKTEKVEQVFVN